jgi:plastocyanin
VRWGGGAGEGALEPSTRRIEDTMNRSILCLVALGALGASAGLPGAAIAGSAGTAATTITLAATDFKFGAKSNNKLTAKVGDKLKFVWKAGTHNVVSTKVPQGAKKVNSGTPAAKHAPLVVTLAKKGQYQFICQPHVTLGMKVIVTVK